METPADKIKRLQQEIENEKNVQRNCKHNFDPAKYDPEPYQEMDDRNGYEVHGVDRWPKFSSHTEYKPRWSRKCKICGFVEYTYKQKTTKIEQEPDFGK